jgi:predicted NBD/HSP70 family sugar kinase
MYLGIDIGGTKTLVASLTEDGRIQASQKFPTPQDYQQFLQQLLDNVVKLTIDLPTMACVAVPGVLDETRTQLISLGNLPWANKPIVDDLRNLLSCSTVADNDAKLAGLSEAILIKDEFKKVLYVTISTGIGYGLVVDGVIDYNISDSSGHTLMLEHEGQKVAWETFASGKAIKEKYGKLASEIEDPAIWQAISKNITTGLIDLISVLQPEVIVIGGGVGAHFDKFAQPLTEQLKAYEDPMMPIPPLRQAQHAEQAVIYGCYELIKQTNATTNQTT